MRFHRRTWLKIAITRTFQSTNYFEQCAHFNALYFCNEPAERLWIECSPDSGTVVISRRRRNISLRRIKLSKRAILTQDGVTDCCPSDVSVFLIVLLIDRLRRLLTGLLYNTYVYSSKDRSNNAALFRHLCCYVVNAQSLKKDQWRTQDYTI